MKYEKKPQSTLLQCLHVQRYMCVPPATELENAHPRKLPRASTFIQKTSETDESGIQLRDSRAVSLKYVHTVVQAGRQIPLCASKRKLDILERGVRRRAICAIIQPNLYKQQFGSLRSGADVRGSYSHILRPRHRKDAEEKPRLDFRREPSKTIRVSSSRVGPRRAAPCRTICK